MSGPLTEARQHVATALAAAGVRVYSEPVENPAPPCLEVGPGLDQWVTRKRLKGKQADVAINVRVTVAVVSGNEQALGKIEALIWDVMGLVPILGDVAPPRLDSNNQVDVYMVDLPTMVTTSE